MWQAIASLFSSTETSNETSEGNSASSSNSESGAYTQDLRASGGGITITPAQTSTTQLAGLAIFATLAVVAITAASKGGN